MRSSRSHLRWRCSLLVFSVVASELRADYLAQPVTEVDSAPYVYTGSLHTYGDDYMASGTVVGAERVVTTAAHMLYFEEGKVWRSGLYWRWKGSEGSEEIRGWRYFSSYADAVMDGDSDRAFSEDFAAGTNYRSLVGEAEYGPISESPAQAVLSNQSKLILGFPAGLYEWGDPLAEKMHAAGPFYLRWEQIRSDFYGVEGATLGPGGSGGGIWVREGSDWEWCGLLVSGVAKALGDELNATGVVVLGPAKRQLLEEVIEPVRRRVPEVLSFSSSISVPYQTPVELTVQCRGFPRYEVAWQWRDRAGEIKTIETYSAVDERTYRYDIPTKNMRFHETAFRVVLTNSEGVTETPWIDFSYSDLVAPKILSAPTELNLGPGEEGEIRIEYEGVPAPELIWETKPESAWARALFPDRPTVFSISENVFHARADRPELDDALVRLKVRNGIGAVWTDWIPISVEGVFGPVGYRDPAPGVIPVGGSVVVGVEAPPWAGVRWLRRPPDYGDHGESYWSNLEEGERFPWCEFISDREVRVNNLPGLTFHGDQIRADVYMGYNSLRYGYMGTLEELDTVFLRPEGDPRPSRIQWAEDHYEFVYSCASPVEVEWQVFDAMTSLWRPQPGSREVNHREGTVSRWEGLKPTRVAPIRAVIRQAGRDPVITEIGQHHWKATPLPAWMGISEFLETEGTPYGFSPEQEPKVFFQPRSITSRVLYAGVEWMPAAPLRYDDFFSSTSNERQFGAGGVLPDQTLVVQSIGDPATEEWIEGGVRFYPFLDPEGEPGMVWAAPTVLRIPQSDRPDETIRHLEIVDGNLICVITSSEVGGERMHWLARDQDDGTWRYAGVLHRPGGVAVDAWPVHDLKCFHADGRIFLGGSNERVERHLLVELSYDSALGSFGMVVQGDAPAPVLAFAGGRFWGTVQAASGRLGVFSAAFSEAGDLAVSPVQDLGVEDLHSPVFGPSGMSALTDLVSVSSGYYRGLLYFPLESGGSRFASPLRFSTYDEPDIRYFTPLRALSDSSFDFLYRTDHRWKLVRCDLSDFPDAPAVAQSPWVRVEPGISGSAARVFFRHEKQGLVQTQFEASLDLSRWETVELDSELVSPDYDGDGKTELRALELPPPSEGAAYYRLIEE